MQDEEFSASDPGNFQDLFRLVVGTGATQEIFHVTSALSNEELVERLVNSGLIVSVTIEQAMKACDRQIFVPEEYREDALFDAPIHVAQHDYRISAPHMHATCLASLEVREGMCVLDVGSGCGLSTAYLAMLAGKRGTVTGMDRKISCVEHARSSLAKLQADASGLFSSSASTCIFEVADAFIACETDHKGLYDRVHVGGSCPRSRAYSLLKFLKPEGGKIIIPIDPSDLTVISKDVDGNISEEVVTQVRFTSLDIPSEVDVVNAVLKWTKKPRMTPPKIPSTYHEDLSAIRLSLKGASFEENKPSPQGMCIVRVENTSMESNFVDCSAWCYAASHAFPNSPGIGDILQNLGSPDCVLRASTGDWEIPVHRVVLTHRCGYFKAMSESGMADSNLSSITVPYGIGKNAGEIFVRYMYEDVVDVREQDIAQVLELGSFYGVPRITHHCENILADSLKAARRSEKHIKGLFQSSCNGTYEMLRVLISKKMLGCADNSGHAISCFCLSQKMDLRYLLAVSLDFIVSNYRIVSRQEEWGLLDREQLLLIAEEGCQQLEEIKALLNSN